MPLTVTETGTFATPNGSKYLQQLCKHFGHKVDVDYDHQTGTVAFPMGPAKMQADETGLTVVFTLSKPEDVPAAHSVIDRHLETFAFREDFKGMVWQSA